MLPTTAPQGNGTQTSRDAVRHTAGAKRYKYLRRLFRFKQMDFEFALWQMLYLFTSPQKVYRNFHYRKQTKDQWARDDPAFLVLLGIWLCGKFMGGKLTPASYQGSAMYRVFIHLGCSVILFSFPSVSPCPVCVVSTVGFGLVLDMGFVETLKLLLWVVLVDCIGVGLLISTLMW